MVDNLVRNFITWAFSENRSSLNLTIIGVFLSHFKIVRRGKNIRIFLFLILDSSKFLKSQSVELDPNVFAIYNLYSDKQLSFASFFKSLTAFSSTGYLDAKKRITTLSFVYSKLQCSIQRSLVKTFLLNYISCFLHHLFIKFFNLNKHFLKFNINIDPVFIKTINFINANFLSRFLSRRLSYGFELNRVLKPVILNLKRLVDSRYSKIIGFRISCRGRFNKTQMASYTWEKYGPVPLNNFSCSINYSFSKVIMKYGACGIKVWVFTSHSSFKGYRSSLLRQHIVLDSNKFTAISGQFPLQILNRRNYNLRKSISLFKLIFGIPNLEPFLVALVGLKFIK